MSAPLNLDIKEWSERVASGYGDSAALMTRARQLLAEEVGAHLRRAVLLGDEQVSSWPRYVNKALDAWEEKFPSRGLRISAFRQDAGEVEFRPSPDQSDPPE